MSDPLIYTENGRLRLELPAPPDDRTFYPVSGAVLQGFVDQVNELRDERDQLRAAPRELATTGGVFTFGPDITDEQIEELKQRINQPHHLTVLTDARDDWPIQQQWAAFCGGSDPDESAHLELFDDPADAEEIAAWLEGGQVAARSVAYGPWVVHQVTRDPTAPPMHPTNRDLNQMEGP